MNNVIKTQGERMTDKILSDFSDRSEPMEKRLLKRIKAGKYAKYIDHAAGQGDTAKSIFSVLFTTDMGC